MGTLRKTWHLRDEDILYVKRTMMESMEHPERKDSQREN